MEHYLKGKKTHESTCKHIASIHQSGKLRPGISVNEVKKSELVSKEGEPKIECISHEGRITRILITCRCGEQIELHCNY